MVSFCLAFDTTQSTASNRVKVYQNGVQVTDFGTADYPTQNRDLFFNHSSSTEKIGVLSYSNANYWDGYMAEFQSVDGQQLDASSFGEFDTDSGVWKPKQYAGTYGTNGFYLKFNNTGNIGEDSSGNDNTFSPTNLSGTTDIMIDTPTRNFCTINPLDRLNIGGANSDQVISEANLKITGTSNEGRSMGSTIHITPNGISKDYCEWYGLAGNTGTPAQDLFYSNNINGYIANDNVGADSIVMMAVDCVAGKYWFGNNGVWDGSGDPANGTNPTGTFTANSEVQWGHRCYNSTRTQVVNFGQDSTFAGNKTRQSNSDSNGEGS